MDELGHLGWVAHRSYEIDGMLFGIRTNSEACAGWLDDVLGDHAVTDEVAEPNYSIVIGQKARIGKRYHILYRDSGVLVRTFDLKTLARVLIAEVESLTFFDRDDAAYVQQALVTRDGVNALVPHELIPYFDEIPRKVDQAGLTLPLSTFVAVDLGGAGTVVPLARTLDVPPDAAARLARLATSDGGLARAEVEQPTRVELVCGMNFVTEDPFRFVSRGIALFTLAANTKNIDVIRSQGLQALARIVEGKDCYQLTAGRKESMLEALTGLMQAAKDEAGAVTS